MNAYEVRKENARQIAIDWQEVHSQENQSWADVQEAQTYLERLAKKYGLTKEFKENGII